LLLQWVVAASSTVQYLLQLQAGRLKAGLLTDTALPYVAPNPYPNAASDSVLMQCAPGMSAAAKAVTGGHWRGATSIKACVSDTLLNVAAASAAMIPVSPLLPVDAMAGSALEAGHLQSPPANK
jgi:hypothetical protein